jgi:hypothetical protein
MVITTRSTSNNNPSGTPTQDTTTTTPTSSSDLPSTIVAVLPPTVTPETTRIPTTTGRQNESSEEAVVLSTNLSTAEFPAVGSTRVASSTNNAPPPQNEATLQESLELAVSGPRAVVMDYGYEEEEGEDILNLDTALAHANNSSKTAGKKLASGQTVHTEGYCTRKKRYIRSFIEALKKEAPKWNAFLKPTREIPDFFQLQEEEGGTTIEAVFILLYPGDGMDRNKKVRTLSDMLVDWVNNLEITEGKGGKKKEKEGTSKKWHAPATINVMIRSFLAATKDFFGWDFAISEFNHVGGFNAFLKNLFAERQKIDVSNC